MKLKWIMLILIFHFRNDLITAQTKNENNSSLVEDLTENSADQINESGQTEIPDEIIDLINHPIDLNGDGIELLVKYSLISPAQGEALSNYIIHMGKLIEIEELQQVEGFDKKTIMSILPYCTVHLQKQEAGLHTLTLRYQKSLTVDQEHYNASNSKMLIRYRGSFSSKLKLSCTFEKDEGEEMFTRNKPGFDFNSINISYKGIRSLRKVIAGDYNVEFGQGLNAWSGTAFGSGTSITGIYKNGRGLVPYSGTDENRFFRGLAVSYVKRKLQTDVWISYHGIDGNLISDSLSKEEYVTSLQTSGYHRSLEENQDYHSQTESAAGVNLLYSGKRINIGLVSIAEKFKYPVKNNPQPYNKYYFSGRENVNSGIYYSLSYKNLLFFGEASYNYKHSTAFVSGVILSLDPRLSIGILYRSYPLNFTGLKSNSFGVNSNNSNETGTYYGINYKIIRTLSISSYVDIYSFPFIKYRVDQPSQGSDFWYQLDFTPTKKFTAQARYRSKLKQQNTINENQDIHTLSDFQYNTLRFSIRFKIDNTWEYGFRTEYLIQKTDKIESGIGEMISQDLFYHPMGKPYSANCRYAIFNCPEFESRIYQFENDLQGAFSVPFYYGSGSRFYVNLNYKFARHFTFSLRYSKSWIDEGESSGKSDIKVQLIAKM